VTFVFLSCGLLGMMAQGTFERVGRTYGDVDIYFWLDSVGPPSTRSVAMRVYGQLPHRQATFTIDTGASINVLSPRMAQELGIQPDTADSSVIEGIGTTTARLATADSLRLGNALFLNVPFHIVNVFTGDSLVDSYLTHLEAILGRPLLEALGTTTFDFESRHITAPEHPKKRQKRTRRSNLSIDDNSLTLTLTHKVDKHVTDTLRLLTDFGATHTTLGPDYFFRHPTQFQTVRPDTVYFGGIGGLTKVLEYRLTDFPLWMSKRKSVLVPSLTVSASPTYEPRLGLDFFSHLRSVTIDLRRWRLILEPYK
jgi:hypothetical protein